MYKCTSGLVYDLVTADMILLGDILLKYLSCPLLRIGRDACYMQVKEPIIAARAVSRSLHSIRELEYNQRMVKLIADPS